ncbi:MAG: hypothetical protein CFE43_15395 [Burkholderiales bacterium PBB3]|nr:MAG: hypothetical protein CFE43_15395 [Burkholderiales bacterium PBB3]
MVVTVAIWPSPSAKALGAADRQWRAAISLVLPLGVVIAPHFLALGDVPLCAFKHVTGLPCPLCGGIRACGALAQGDVASAWLLNPGLLPVLAVAAVHSVLLVAEAATGKRYGTPRWLAAAWQLAAVGWLVSWLIRMIYFSA